MPNRIIREGWIESERIAQLDAQAERFFLRLCLRADDFGRYHGNPTLLKSNLFPLCEDIRSTDIPRWLAACEKAGLVRCYEAHGKRCVEIPRFDQRMRATVSKFPTPPENCGQMSDKCQTDVRHPPAYSEAYSESKSEAKAVAPPARASVVPLLLNTEEFAVAWADWLQHRREKKEPVKPGSQTERQQLKTLETWGVTRAIAAIRHTIFKGWTGLREPDESDVRVAKANTAQTARVFIAP